MPYIADGVDGMFLVISFSADNPVASRVALHHQSPLTDNLWEAHRK